MKTKILVGMSGGVDSTVSAMRLRKDGYDVEGAVLVMSEHTDTEAAVRAADAVGIPLHIVDCRSDFDRLVKREFAAEYLRGRTPNPCVICNRFVKIEYLCRTAREIGAEKVATGHYCGIGYDETTGRVFPTMGKDKKKDQSYVFWNLTQEQLSMLYCPLTGRTKDETVAEAGAVGLPVPDGESQDICFLPDGNHAAYIESVAGRQPEGDFIDENGTVIGRHKGIIHYTVGQRKGLGIALGHPAFVSRICAEDNTVQLTDESALFRTSFTCSGLNFCKLPPRDRGEIRALVKVRYAAPPTEAVVTWENGVANVLLSEPARAVTPGQSAVFYDGT
ncbi:MAG: tRNA 2-thiouridine(34) synthase MnmA, partial [Ruminococcus sp.]|nr:tRNA 2-thiouridine(34) synthase MnmA [Candidatus Apopatosoma intestinale]